MDFIKKILEILEKIVFVTDKKRNIIWMNNYARKKFDLNDTKNNNFDKMFKDIKNLKENQIIKDLKGRKFKIDLYEKYTEFETRNIIIITSISDYQDDKIRLYCLEKIIESIDNGIILSDINGKVLLYNESQQCIEGIKKENIIGKNLSDVYDYNICGKSEHRKVYTTKKPIKDRYRKLTYKDGTSKQLHYSTYPIERDGEILGVFSVSTNERLLQQLLSEVTELKYQLAHKNTNKESKYSMKNGTRYTFKNLVGGDEILKIVKESKKIALLDSNILIVGETGTGKEVFAQSIHNYGKYKDEPFIPINCAAIPENLLESILFGTIKGAYTGALDTPGLFEEAKNGTLFLDELNSMPVSMQTKLLRVIQERRATRVGSSKMYNIDCRIISAINESPKELIKEGRFRQDLFYRISSLTIKVPSLSQRIEDIEILSEFFFSKYNLKLGKNIVSMSNDLIKLLKSHSWPGNVREFEYIIENLMIRCDDNEDILKLEHLPNHIREELDIIDIDKEDINNLDILKMEENQSLSEKLKEIEKEIIINTLSNTNWNISKSSKELNIIRQSLIYRIKKLGIIRL